MMRIDIEAFEKWVMEPGHRRAVKIEIGSVSDPEYRRIWVYDFDLSAGQHVTSVEEINLVEAMRQEIEQRVERARALGIQV